MLLPIVPWVPRCDNYGRLFSRAKMCILYEIGFDEELGILGQDATSIDNNKRFGGACSFHLQGLSRLGLFGR